jgi:hypothetical protein
MAKEFEVLDVGFLGSFIEERADNDGDDIKKSISLGVPDNNIWVLNPITGLLESKVSMGDTNDPQFVQFNGTKPTAPTTDLIIKTIGHTLKVVNSTNTELCVSQSFSVPNFVYDPKAFPKEYNSCEKAIYFTSNNKIQWPSSIQTHNMLNDLSRKIPYDIGFSKKYYKLGKLTHEHLKHIQDSTNISMDFLKRFDVLFLFDSEYPDNIDFSKIKLSFEWDGFSIDENDSNNFVYSDYYKDSGAVYANFVFLVTDYTLNNLQKYFSGDIQKRTQFENRTIFDPRVEQPPRPQQTNTYKRLVTFPTETDERPSPNEILSTITTKKLYEATSQITDVDLVEDMLTTQIFFEVYDVFNVDSLSQNTPPSEDGAIEGSSTPDPIVAAQNRIQTAFADNTLQSAVEVGSVNAKVYSYLNKYYTLQEQQGYPSIDLITIVTSSYGILDESNPFIGLPTPSPIETLGDSIQQQEVIQTNIENFDLPQFVYKRLNYQTDYAISDLFYMTKPLFLNGKDNNTVFYYSEPNYPNSKYFIDVKTDTEISVQNQTLFSIAYAHKDGLGSSYILDQLGYGYDQLPSKGLYKKYMTECFGGSETIKFKDGKESDYFYVLQFNRDLFKDKINNGNISITLSPISSSTNQLINTGSNFEFDQSSSEIFTLIDDSLLSKTYSDKIGALDECYNIVQGTIQDGPIDYETSEGWGLVFPNKGLILLDGEVLDKYCNLNTVTSSIDGDNPRKLFLSISGSCSPNSSRENHGSWYMRSAQLYADDNYFCRIGRNEFNYSNNYTYTSGSTMRVFMDKINNTTKTYVSSIGLYDDSNNLLAVGKFNKPFTKDSSMEYVVNVKFRRM